MLCLNPRQIQTQSEPLVRTDGSLFLFRLAIANGFECDKSDLLWIFFF
jgi:hypothetical protein